MSGPWRAAYPDGAAAGGRVDLVRAAGLARSGGWAEERRRPVRPPRAARPAEDALGVSRMHDGVKKLMNRLGELVRGAAPTAASTSRAASVVMRGEVRGVGDAVAGDERAPVVRLGLAQRLAEVRRAELHVARHERDTGEVSMNACVRPEAVSLRATFRAAPSAAQPKITACLLRGIRSGRRRWESARDEACGSGGMAARPAQIRPVVSQS